jgi:hypothetical protein
MNHISSIQCTNTIITVASWEERFLLGMNQLIETIRPSNVLMFHFKEYADWSSDNRMQVSEVCERNGIKLQGNMELSFSAPLESWKELVGQIRQSLVPGELITLDVSTMPREVIWSICHVLSQQQTPLQYVYHMPQENGYSGWLSRDPGRPRIIYRLAGIQHLGRQTALILQTGYDVERVKQLVRFYEPDKLLLGLQTGDQFQNVEQNRKKHEAAFAKSKDTDLFDVDGYSLNESYHELKMRIEPLLEKYNIILSSLGPKIGALSLFMVKRTFPEVAMSYAPSNEFNRDYSKGIGALIHGILERDLEK